VWIKAPLVTTPLTAVNHPLPVIPSFSSMPHGGGADVVQKSMAKKINR
jgi:hypothetical protein